MFAFNFKPPMDPHKPYETVVFKPNDKPKKESKKPKEDTPKAKTVVAKEPMPQMDTINEVVEKPKVGTKSTKVKSLDPVTQKKVDDIVEGLENPKPARKKIVAGSDEAKEWGRKMKELRDLKKAEKAPEASSGAPVDAQGA
jgi:hypothetical protein